MKNYRDLDLYFVITRSVILIKSALAKRGYNKCPLLYSITYQLNSFEIFKKLNLPILYTRNKVWNGVTRLNLFFLKPNSYEAVCRILASILIDPTSGRPTFNRLLFIDTRTIRLHVHSCVMLLTFIRKNSSGSNFHDINNTCCYSHTMSNLFILNAIRIIMTI